MQLRPPVPDEVIVSSARRARRLVGALAVPAVTALVVAAAVTVRIRYLDSQSYWSDEVFSVNQARVDIPQVLDIGATEVHTPLYALLLHGWIALGGGSAATVWTHALSGVFGLLAMVVSWTGLRRTGLTTRVRWVAVAVVAANGFGIVYAQESRPYGLALLGAVGVTAATASATAALLDRRRPRWELWVCWASLAATAHLLGAVLVGVAGAVLVAVALAVHRWWQALLAPAVVFGALAPQLAWLVVHGRNQPGFAGGTHWIAPAVPQDLLDLLTSTFAAGDLATTAGGYVWRSTTGLAVAGALLLVALLAAAGGGVAAAVRTRTSPVPPDGDSRGPSAEGAVTVSRRYEGPLFAEEPHRDRVLALVLLVLAVLTGAATYVVSQTVHVWTLRNMIVVVPAVVWGVSWLVCAAPPWRRGRQLAALAVLGASAAALVPISAALEKPYKTDFRSALLHLARMRAEQPQATFSFFGGGPVAALVATDRPLDDPQLLNIWDKVDPHRRPTWAIASLRRLPGPQAVLFYTGMSGRDDDAVAAQILGQLADPGCNRVPVHGVVLVTCPGEGTTDGGVSTDGTGVSPGRAARAGSPVRG